MTAKTWFITGASRGFGREWAIAALERGDSVAATARDTSTLDDLVGAVRRPLLPIAARRHRPGRRLRRRRRRRTTGSAGSTSSSTTPATASSAWSRSSARRRPATRSRPTSSAPSGSPRPRCRSCGRRAPATSCRCPPSAGSRAFPNIGMYHASKWALEGISQALAQEVADFGIKVTLIEPGGYSTDWAGPSAKHADAAARRTTTSARRPPSSGAARARTPRRPGGDPGRDPAGRRRRRTRRCGSSSATARWPSPRRDYESRLATWREWEPVSIAAHGNPD